MVVILLFLAGGAAVAAAPGGLAGAGDGHVRPVVVGGLTPVGDADGVVRGEVEEAGLDRLAAVSGAFLGAHDLALTTADAGGRPAVDPDVSALTDAVMDLEAVPVYGAGHDVVGYFGAGFVETTDLPSRQADAAALVREATGAPYRR